MAIIAGFQLATPPNQPQSTGLIVVDYGKVPTYQEPQQVLTINDLFRSSDSGTASAY
jgi:hypothetical protein